MECDSLPMHKSDLRRELHAQLIDDTKSHSPKGANLIRPVRLRRDLVIVRGAIGVGELGAGPNPAHTAPFNPAQSIYLFSGPFRWKPE